MILAALIGLLALQAPASITIATARGEDAVEIRTDAGGAPTLPASGLVTALGGHVRISGSWAEVAIGRQPFRFLLGAPFYSYNDRVQPLAAAAALVHDTLYLPLQVATEVLPRLFPKQYRYDAANDRFMEAGAPAVAARTAPPMTA